MKLVPTSTRNLTDLALNYAVARAEKHQSRCEWMLEQKGYHAWQSYEQAWGNPIPDYCADWAAAGPIIERERIDLNATLNQGSDVGEWRAVKGHGPTSRQRYGATPLIAAMRCYVTSIGDTVEVPEDLL